ncbi:DMT family transporter [Cohaesibacter celericrescens]|uniref:EamA family transporter n=1 Tax=Cohaesibacter celericrescens TaxID=2067669 RepID=A0A2N5XSK6_9HYPH|nr:DMT family transporter [Cohaesibacter celericrescens]PLW77489.1 EamA family transporter [Cohaesibacter celericrescens]
MIPFLFLSTVLIWGTTWIAIAMQVGAVPVLVSVFYRFALASILFLIILAISGRLKLPEKKHQVGLISQALCLFSLNFICFYTAAAFIPSGLISIIFSLATIFNAINARLIFGDRITKRVLLASLLGVSGLALLFGRDIISSETTEIFQGIALAGLGTLFFSLGNMASRRNSQAGISPTIANAWAMGYGAVILLMLIGLTGTPVVAPPDKTYFGALVYLATFGSIVGFTTYLVLVAKIGSAKAAYATVLFPIVALTLSTIYEGYIWHWSGILGLVLALSGNVVMFARKQSLQPSPAQEPLTTK